VRVQRAGLLVRRRLQSVPDLVPSQDTVDTLETAADNLEVKLAGDAVDCLSEFDPVSGGDVTAAMRSNREKLLEVAEHQPFGGFEPLGEWLSRPYDPSTCAPCGPDFSSSGQDCYCSGDSSSGCELPTGGTNCVKNSDDDIGCSWYTTPCTQLPTPADAVMNLVESGASAHPLASTNASLLVGECCRVLGLSVACASRHTCAVREGRCEHGLDSILVR
jgi:hypothetical protein